MSSHIQFVPAVPKVISSLAEIVQLSVQVDPPSIAPRPDLWHKTFSSSLLRTVQCIVYKWYTVDVNRRKYILTSLHTVNREQATVNEQMHPV